MSKVKRYADRDIMELDRDGSHYCNHVLSMTREGLHDKSDIAAELAFRDAALERVTAERDAALGREAKLLGNAEKGKSKYQKQLQRLKVAAGQRNTFKRQVIVLQQRLTAADERVGVLEGILRLIPRRATAYDAKIDAALKPAERAHQLCESCKGSAFRADPETGIDEGCGACGASGYEPAEGGGNGSTCNQIREESGLPAYHPCQACGHGACIDR